MLCTNNAGLLLGEPLAQHGPSALLPSAASRVELAHNAEILLKHLGAAALTLLCKSSGTVQVPAWHWELTHCQWGCSPALVLGDALLEPALDAAWAVLSLHSAQTWATPQRFPWKVAFRSGIS